MLKELTALTGEAGKKLHSRIYSVKTTAFVCICQEKDSGHHCDSGGVLTADIRWLIIESLFVRVIARGPAASGSAERFDVAHRPERVEGLTVEALSNRHHLTIIDQCRRATWIVWLTTRSCPRVSCHPTRTVTVLSPGRGRSLPTFHTRVNLRGPVVPPSASSGFFGSA